MPNAPDSHAGSPFPRTRWSMVLRAATEDDLADQRHEALAALCRAYWPPLYAYIRRRGRTPHDAQDLTQSFLAHLLQKNRLGNVAPEKGLFRSFLLAAVENYLADDWHRSQRQKRGGGVELISIDSEQAESTCSLDPADAGAGADPVKTFERRWALTLLDRVLARLEDEQVRAGRGERFARLQSLLFDEASPDERVTTAEALGMTPGAVRVAVLRLRERFRELFREEIAETTDNEAEVDEEMRHVLSILQG